MDDAKTLKFAKELLLATYLCDGLENVWLCLLNARHHLCHRRHLWQRGHLIDFSGNISLLHLWQHGHLFIDLSENISLLQQIFTHFSNWFDRNYLSHLPLNCIFLQLRKMDWMWNKHSHLATKRPSITGWLLTKSLLIKICGNNETFWVLVKDTFSCDAPTSLNGSRQSCKTRK